MSRPVLPPETLEWVWSRVHVRYGQFFLGRYDGMRIDVVKADWAQELGDLNDEQLQHGLDNLPPGNPPDAGAFRLLCRRAPDHRSEQAALPPPRGPLKIAPAVRALLEPLLQPVKRDEPERITVARRYIAMHGERKDLSIRQREVLAHYRRLLDRYEQGERRRIEEAKARAQAMTDERLQQEGQANA